MTIRQTLGIMASSLAGLLACSAVQAQCEPLLVQRVQPPEVTFFSLFGSSVSLSGDPADRAIIGAFLHNFTGAAFVYRRSGNQWLLDGTLTPDDQKVGSYFGTSVGIDGDWAVVGAPGTQDDEGNDLPGAAYVYERVNNAWTLRQTLQALPGMEFGSAVAISQGRIMVGDPADTEGGPNAGAVYVYNNSGAAWTLEEKILATDATPEDFFGSAIYLDGERAIFGSLLNDQSAIESGAAYIYLWNGDFWFKQAKIAPSDPTQEKWFGFSVHIVDDIAVVGAPQDDDAGVDAGAAYFFEWNGTDWIETLKTTASNTESGDYFGNAVGTDGRKIMVGGYQNDGTAGVDSGNAYMFIRPSGSWQQTSNLVNATDSEAFDSFAISTVVRKEWALVGSLAGGDAGLFAGSAYFYNFQPPLQGDATGDEAVTFNDITESLNFWGATYPSGTRGPGDANHDGVVNFADVTATLNNFGSSCG